MTSPVPRDYKLLSQASTALREAVERFGAEPSVDIRLRLLEGAAAHIGGYDLKRFDEAVGLDTESQHPDAADAAIFSQGLAEAVRDSAVAPSLALAALGDSDLTQVARRRQGRYFTDSRLALSLASGVREKAARAGSILDPACGAGVLLIAATLQVASSTERRAHLVRGVLWGVDRDPHAVRAARAAISSLTNDVGAIARLCRRLLVADSLVVGQEWWQDRAPSGFDLVIANPPWEKLRVTRHEHALGHGHRRHYGDVYRALEIDEEALHRARRANSGYRERVTAELAHQGKGESDLYKMFLELGAKLTSPSGALAFLIPAGLIRNRGTRELREWLFENFDSELLILDNRDRYFAIDSRFKFLQFFGSRRTSDNSKIRFGPGPAAHNPGTSTITTNVQQLRLIQPDLTIPEVKNHGDWARFARIALSYPRFGDDDAGWQVRFHREVDMTNDRPKFRRSAVAQSYLPVIEGRMVHHHRIAAKRYIAGSGRRAEWCVQPPFQAFIQPQWYIDRSDLRPRVRLRVDRTRAGFCDITGQTNERTVLAALVPAGVVCGNKVPTLDLPSQAHTQAWVGLANSFIFDWLARRSVTTTLNFFIIRNLPIPAWAENKEELIRVANTARDLSHLECPSGSGDLWLAARLRAELEVRAATLYGVTVADLDQMLYDFPQVDRAQPPIAGERQSTVTRDLIVASGAGWSSPTGVKAACERIILAKSAGAVPFLPNQHARGYRSVP